MSNGHPTLSLSLPPWQELIPVKEVSSMVILDVIITAALFILADFLWHEHWHRTEARRMQRRTERAAAKAARADERFIREQTANYMRQAATVPA